MEKLSKHQKGSLEWFVDQYGCNLPIKFDYTSRQGSSTGECLKRNLDYSKNIEECADKGKKVYNSYGGLFTCCDGNRVFLIHKVPGIKEVLEKEGYVDPENGELYDWKKSDYVSAPFSPGNWSIDEKGEIHKDFFFGNFRVDTEFDLAGVSASKADRETILSLYKKFKENEQKENEQNQNQPQ